MIFITANKLAEFITAKTPERRRQIVRQAKQRKKAHPNYYSCFHAPAKRFLISGAKDPSDILRALNRLKARNQDTWYARDSRITIEAFRALLKIAPELSRLSVAFVPPGAHSRTKLEFADVHVSVTPNLIIHGERNGKPLIGALRFYVAKESTYELGRRGAELVSVLEYIWLTHLATGARTPDRELCMVLECFQQRITCAPADIGQQAAIIERGCREFAQLWRIIDDEKAA
jgi:hypothetical protein